MTTPKWAGHPNELPPNIERISADDFWRRFTHRRDGRGEGRWFCREDARGTPFAGHGIVWYDEFDQTGYGLIERVEGARAVTPEVYFRFAVCHHDLQHSRTVGRCLNEYVCSKCGHRHVVDSSD